MKSRLIGTLVLVFGSLNLYAQYSDGSPILSNTNAFWENFYIGARYSGIEVEANNKSGLYNTGLPDINLYGFGIGAEYGFTLGSCDNSKTELRIGLFADVFMSSKHCFYDKSHPTFDWYSERATLQMHAIDISIPLSVAYKLCPFSNRDISVIPQLGVQLDAFVYGTAVVECENTYGKDKIKYDILSNDLMYDCKIPNLYIPAFAQCSVEWRHLHFTLGYKYAFLHLQKNKSKKTLIDKSLEVMLGYRF